MKSKLNGKLLIRNIFYLFIYIITLIIVENCMEVSKAPDFKYHMEWSKTIFGGISVVTAYPLMHISIKILSLLPIITIKSSMTIVLSLSIVASILLTSKILSSGFKINKYKSDIFACFLNIIIPFYIPIFDQFIIQSKYIIEGTEWYLGCWSPNMFHSPTYLFMKPFALLSIIVFYNLYKKLVQNMKNYNKLKWYQTKTISIIITSILIVLSILAKPSFAFVFIPTAGLFSIIQIKKLKFKNFILLNLVHILPTVMLIVQFFMTFETDVVSSGVVFVLGDAWHIYIKSISLAIFRVILWPLLFCILFWRKIDFKNNIKLQFAWLFYIVGALQYVFIAESGTRMSDSNFSWQYSFSIFILYIINATEFLRLEGESSKKDMAIKSILYYQIFTGAVILFNSMIALKVL